MENSGRPRRSGKMSLNQPSGRILSCGRVETVEDGEDQETNLPSMGTHMQNGKFFDTKCPFKKHFLTNSNPGSGSPSTHRPPVDSISNWEAPRGKRALLCGVTYDKQKFKLKGTINDVTGMRDLLMKYFRFPSTSIHILAETVWHLHPTKKNIQEALRWLVKDCQQGDSLVFYFSGHGLQQPDFDEDEIDGFDETLCPLDYVTAGMIADNEINETIVRPLKAGVTLHAIIDACHSGTILDLPHVYSNKDKTWRDNFPPSGAYKGTSGGTAISLSACEDDQLAADTSAFSGAGRQMEGAMTYTFRKAIKENPGVTYAGLLSSMHKAILEARRSKLFKLGLFHRHPLQEPLLSSSHKFNIEEQFVL